LRKALEDKEISNAIRFDYHRLGASVSLSVGHRARVRDHRFDRRQYLKV